MLILIVKLVAGLIAAIIATKLVTIKTGTAEGKWQFGKWKLSTESMLGIGTLWIALASSTGMDVVKYFGDQQTAKAQAAKEKALEEREIEIRELARRANSEIDIANSQLKASATTLGLVSGTTSETLGQVNTANDKIEASAGTLGAVVGMADNLLDRQQEQIQQLNRVSLDRDVSELEISFKPSDSHWSEIAKEYERIEASDPSKPGAHYYQHTTMVAENLGDQWKISFKAMDRGVPFSTFSTSQPDGKAFEMVIKAVNKFLTLRIKLADDTEIKLIESGRTSPTLISISRNNITFRFRPPNMKLNLGRLKANPTVTFSGRAYPDRIKVQSLDPGVTLDSTIALKWVQGDDEASPDVSGPHRLKITFTNISP